jgi:ATP-dependent RNA helicase RhlE
MVINYDVPRDPEDYVHRVGRTARAAKQGSGRHVRERASEMREFGRIEIAHRLRREARCPCQKPVRHPDRNYRPDAPKRSRPAVVAGNGNGAAAP